MDNKWLSICWIIKANIFAQFNKYILGHFSTCTNFPVLYRNWIFRFHCNKGLPWRKYWIEIHSESIRTIPIHSYICILANANHSEPIWKTFCISFDMKGGQKSIWLNPIYSETSIRMNPNQSETKFSIQITRARSDPNRIFNQNQSEYFRPWIHSDCLRLNNRFG